MGYPDIPPIHVRIVEDDTKTPEKPCTYHTTLRTITLDATGATGPATYPICKADPAIEYVEIASHDQACGVTSENPGSSSIAAALGNNFPGWLVSQGTTGAPNTRIPGNQALYLVGFTGNTPTRVSWMVIRRQSGA